MGGKEYKTVVVRLRKELIVLLASFLVNVKRLKDISK